MRTMPQMKKPKRSPTKKSEEDLDGVQSKITVQEFYEIEDDLATSSSPVEDESLFIKACDELATTFKQFSDAKDEAEKSELKSRITLAIVLIRRFNRLGHFRNKKIRNSVTEQRQKVEEQHLQLQNLIHEVQHLQKEVTRCLEFKSAHERINLVPMNDFFEKAPAEIAKPEVTKSDSHQLRLARLTWELEQRKTLSKQVEAVEGTKQEIRNEVCKRSQRLATLKPKLESVLVATRPLQEMMEMKYEEEAVEREMAHYLAKPLYYLYLQARAYKEILDHALTVSIHGDMELAKKMNSVELKSESETPEERSGNEEEDDEDMLKEAGGVSKRKRRATVSEAVEKHKWDILKLHPLCVELKVPCRDQATVFLSFWYCPYLEIVTAKTRVELVADTPRAVASAGNLLSDSTILQLLCENDSGLSCPNPTGLKKLEHFSIELGSKVKDLGHPYIWTQRVAGLTFRKESQLLIVHEEKDEVEGCNFLQDILAKVKERILSRLSLQQQIASLELQRVLPTTNVEGLGTSKLMSRLISWKSLTHDDYKCHPATQQFQDFPSDGWFFSATLERNEAKLVALICVGAAYPIAPPSFVLILKWRGTRTASDWEPLRCLEEGVNLHLIESVPRRSRDQLLMIQMYYLISRLDILLEAEASRTGGLDFQRDHLFSRTARGKSRELPLCYRKFTNSFGF